MRPLFFVANATIGRPIKQVHFGDFLFFYTSFFHPKSTSTISAFPPPFSMFNYSPAITLWATFSHTNKKVIKNIQKSQCLTDFFKYTTHRFYYQSPRLRQKNLSFIMRDFFNLKTCVSYFISLLSPITPLNSSIFSFNNWLLRASKFRRKTGSLADGRTLKRQSTKSKLTPSISNILPCP